MDSSFISHLRWIIISDDTRNNISCSKYIFVDDNIPVLKLIIITLTIPTSEGIAPR